MTQNLIAARPSGETEARKRDLPIATSYGDGAQNFAVLVLNFPLACMLATLGFLLGTDPKAASEELQRGLNGAGARLKQDLLQRSGHGLRGSSMPAH